MKELAIILVFCMIGFVLDLLMSGPQSPSEREDYLRNGKEKK